MARVVRCRTRRRQDDRVAEELGKDFGNGLRRKCLSVNGPQAMSSATVSSRVKGVTVRKHRLGRGTKSITRPALTGGQIIVCTSVDATAFAEVLRRELAARRASSLHSPASRWRRLRFAPISLSREATRSAPMRHLLTCTLRVSADSVLAQTTGSPPQPRPHRDKRLNLKRRNHVCAVPGWRVPVRGRFCRVPAPLHRDNSLRLHELVHGHASAWASGFREHVR